MYNIKDTPITRGSFWVKSDKQTNYTDGNGNFYELWGDTLAIVATDSGALTKVNMI